jgi:signal transduction histidine kinase
MNDNHKMNYRRATYLQIGVCGVLFATFSFIYLYVFQGDVIEALHYSLAKGRTSYSPLIGAFIITLVLLIFRWGINKLMGLKGPLRTLAYFPSCLLLGVLTDVHRGAFHGDHFAGYWQWLLPLILAVYVVICFALRRMLRNWLNREINSSNMWNSNLLILLICFSVTIAIGTTGVDFHRELLAEEYLRRHDYQKALLVGKRSTETTHTLTALRAFTLSLNGTMGESIFEYPQPYGADGLMFPKDTCLTLRLNNDSLTNYLAGPRRKGETTVAYLERGFNDGDGRYTVFDYYLCALLLDKQLDRFVRVVQHNLEQDSIPRHYREALALYQSTHPEYKGLTADSQTVAQLDTFIVRSKQYSSPVEEKNRMRQEFGNTYWWYFRYQ